MRAIYFALLVFGLLFAPVVDVGGGSGSQQVIVKTGETVTIVNVSHSAGIGFVNEKGEEIVMESGGGMPSATQEVKAVEITPSSVVADGKEVRPDEGIPVQTASANMVVVQEQNRVVVSDSAASAEVKTQIMYKEQAMVSTKSNKEIKIGPSIAVKAIPAHARIKNIELTDDGTAPVYKISAVSNGKIFFILPVEMEVNYRIDATSGQVIAEEKPFWSVLVWS